MPKNYFWQSDCISNLAILYGLCILDSSFLYQPLLHGGYLLLIVLFFITAVTCCYYDGEKIVSGSGDNTLRIWTVHPPRCQCVMTGHTAEVVG